MNNWKLLKLSEIVNFCAEGNAFMSTFSRDVEWNGPKTLLIKV